MGLKVVLLLHWGCFLGFLSLLYFGIVGWICLFVVFVDLDPDCFFVFFILGLWWRFLFWLSFVVFLVLAWLLFWIEFVVFCLRG